MKTFLRALHLSRVAALPQSLLVLIFTCCFVFFTSAQAPVISSFSPGSGPVGSTVTITGSNFSPVAENNIVYIGRVKAVVTAASATSLAVTVPAGPTDQPLSVTMNGLTAYSTKPFVVTFPCSNATLSFAKTNYVVVGGPLADIDGDGKVDFVVSKAPDSLSILRNLSVGDAIAFAPRVSLQTGSTNVKNVKIFDWDGDGKLDLVVVNTASNTISLLRNTSTPGTISFAPKVDVPFTGSPTIVDWDGDGKLDVAVVNAASNTFSLLRNTSSIGNFSFAPKVEVPVPGTGLIRDLNGDGKPDLYSILSGFRRGILSVYLNISTAETIAFADKVDFPIPVRPGSVYIEDFDGDGKPDFGFLDPDYWLFSVLRNTSTGNAVSFEAAGQYTTARLPISLDIVDLDRDGKPDLLTSGGSYPNYYSTVLRNTSIPGIISFASGQEYPGGVYANPPIIGDLNGDGKPELVVNSVTGDNCSRDSSLTTIFQNTSTAGSISFRGAKVFTSAGCGGYGGPIVDLNGDGKSELFINGSPYETVCTTCTPPTFKNDPTIVLAASCANNDGNISIIPTSGTAPFMYSKDGGATYVAGSDSGSGFQGLSAGVYELRLKDANGCESAIVEKEVKLNCATTCTPPTFKNDLTIVLDASCANNDGNISIIPTSGTAPFMYSKDGGATYISGSDLGSGFQGLSPGVYRLRLKDAKGCESAIIEREVKLNCPTTCTPPTFKNDLTIVLDASCANNDGQISIIPTSGTAPFMYSKDGGATYVSGSDLGSGFQGLSAGVYKLRLKDAKGCESAIIEREVKLNCPITCTLPTFKNDGTIVLDASCGNNDGNITIVPMSGSGPFMYSINGGTTYITGADYGYTFANLSAGTYQLRLKDAKGCESAIVERTVRNYYGCSGVIVASTSTDQLSLAANKEAISTYPNPSKGQFRLQLHNSISTKADISVINPEGRLIEKRIVQLVKTNTIDFDLTGRPEGMYYIKITSNNGTKTAKVLVQ